MRLLLGISCLVASGSALHVATPSGAAPTGAKARRAWDNQQLPWFTPERGADGSGEGEAEAHERLLDMVDVLSQGNYSVAEHSHVTQCSARLTVSPTWFPEPAAATKAPMPEGARGALVVSSSVRGAWHPKGPAASDAADKWRCQLNTIEAYCKKHGYTFYFVNDTAEREAEREKDGLRPYWLKIQTLRELLPQHAWVMHLDTDAMFPAPDSSHPVEHLFASAPEGSRDASLFVPDDIAWNTDVVLVRNTDWGRAFLERVWALREPCPMVVKGSEQGALELAVLHSALEHQIEAGGPDISHVRSTFISSPNQESGDSSCCFPTAFCHYPLGRAGPRNARADNRPMFCVASWLYQYFKRFNATHDDGWVSTGHPHIVWNTELRSTLDLVHPVKTGTSCECLKGRYEHQARQDRYKECKSW